ncbi:hypothetical protein [Nocardioides sp. P5_C9_2]
MDDAAYVRELFAILTNPSPTGIDPADPYGQADDGIDRYDGFGRDVRVTSARVVAGEHAPMMELGFVLDLPAAPDLDGVPAEGSFLLPVDAEWRRLSGYDDPADHAPEVARRVQRAAARHVQRHRFGAQTLSTAALPDRSRQWQMLLDGLAKEGQVREPAPGRFELALRGQDDRSPVVTVVVTPDQWGRVVLRHGVHLAPGDFFMEKFGPLDPLRQAFVVFWEDDLVASSREELPPVDPPRDLRFVPGGRWSTESHDGTRHHLDEFPPER